MVFRMLILLVSFLLAVFLIILLCYSVSFWTLHLPKEKMECEEPKIKNEKKTEKMSRRKEEPKEEETSYTVIHLPPPANYPPAEDRSSDESVPETPSPEEDPPKEEIRKEEEPVPEP